MQGLKHLAQRLKDSHPSAYKYSLLTEKYNDRNKYNKLKKHNNLIEAFNLVGKYNVLTNNFKNLILNRNQVIDNTKHPQSLAVQAGLNHHLMKRDDFLILLRHPRVFHPCQVLKVQGFLMHREHHEFQVLEVCHRSRNPAQLKADLNLAVLA